MLLSAGIGFPVAAQATYTVFPVTPSVAQPTDTAGALVSLDVQDSTVGYVVRTLVHQAHLRVSYINGPLFARRVTVHIPRTDVLNALTIALRGTGLAARMAADGETVLVSAQQGKTAGGKHVVSGVLAGLVTDSTTGAGLQGVQVQVQGVKGLSVTTSDSGNFTLRNVPPGDQVLQARLFGYRPVTRPVTVVDGERTTVRLSMASVPTVLSGVVTTATGVQRKVEVGNDITSINVDSVMRVAPISSVTDLLETRVPGLTVQHTSGVPGNPSRIRIRGVGSITGNNDPIVIIDGVRVYASQSDPRNSNLAPRDNAVGVVGPGGSVYAAPSPLDQIDPASIETIEVFKGPSASALYGSDAANGVIVVTTKHGRAGPTHWTLTLGDGVNYTPGKWPVNYYRFGQDATNFPGPQGQCFWDDLTCFVDSIVPFQALNTPSMTLFSHGSDQTADLTVSGGISTLIYSLTGSAASDVGLLKLPGIEVQRYEKFYGSIPDWMVRPDNYNTNSLSGQLMAQPNAKLRVSLLSSLFNSKQQQGSLQQAITQLEGVYINPAKLVSTPLLQNETERATDHQLTSTNALTLNWQPLSWLPLTATGGLNAMQRTDETYTPFGINSAGAVGPVLDQDTTGHYGYGHGSSLDQTLNVGTTLPVRWVTMAIGANLHQGSTNDFSAANDTLAPGISSTSTLFNASQDKSASSTYGWYVEPRLNLNSRFFVAPGFRLDGGSASGTHGGFNGTGLTGFPKIDLSYIAVDRSHPRGLLTMFRPRLAFGYAGTQPGPTEKLRLFQASTFGSNALPVVALSTLGNTQLQPERSSELEGGFDAEVWQGRLTLTWTQYNKTRHNAIISIPVAPDVYSGQNGTVQSIYKNIGVVRNTGTELTVQANLVESRAVSWSVGTNLSNNNNLVVRLNPGQAPITMGDVGAQGTLGGSPVTRIIAGYPLFSRWALPIEAFADVNGDRVIEPQEIVYGDSLVYVGQEAPKYQLNANTNVTLFSGRLSVNAQFAYQNGMTQDNNDAGSYILLPNKPGTSFATQAAVVAAYGATNKNDNRFFNRTGIGFLQTANTFRFNAISVNYTLPTGLTRWLHVPRAALALQGSNLYLHTNYRGKDPNVNAYSTVSAADQTIDAGQLPQPRVWWLKLTLGN